MKLGLFGGRFDPPHLGHLLVAEGARAALGLDEVLFIPSKAPPHKGVEASAQARYEMTLLATADNPQFRASDLELRREGVSYTIDTVEALLEQDPDADLFYLTGVDAYRDIATWQRARDLVARVQMVTYPRPGYSFAGLEPYFLNRVRRLKLPLFGISGTAIRQRLRTGESVKYLVPDSVAAYIGKYAVYERGLEESPALSSALSPLPQTPEPKPSPQENP